MTTSPENTSITLPEAKLIARDAAEEAVKKHTQDLPGMMKPIMYEVAESVSSKQKSEFVGLFSKVMGADVLNDEHIRDLHKDLYWLRDKRIAHERRVTVMFDSVITMASRWTFFAVIIAMLAFLGIKIKGG